MRTTLSLTRSQHSELMAHLHPRDGKEAVAFALCGRLAGTTVHRLMVHKLLMIPYELCSHRAFDRVSWPTEPIIPFLKEAAKYSLALVKFHGHHKDYPHFSKVDDISDQDLFPSIYGWVDGDMPHASAILLSNGRLHGRAVGLEGEFTPLEAINIIGDDLTFDYPYISDEDLNTEVPEFALRHAQAFGEATYKRLHNLSIAVVGYSGIGSPVVEQLARLGVGRLIIVEPDYIETKNLNRILNSTAQDATRQVLKTDVARRAIEAMGLGTEVITISENLFNPAVITAVAECDVVFGCMDTVDGRYLLNKLSTFYLIPYFDVGVRLEADGQGGIDQISGGVHYLQPGLSSLWSRGVFTLEDVRVAGLKRKQPDEYIEQVKSKYIVGVQEDRPAVISVNMFYAALAVNEFLARLHPYRLDPNEQFAINRLSLSHKLWLTELEGEPCPTLSKYMGRGDMTPLLNMPELDTK
jgi:ThiF family